jgi:uncharacterized DUF497 family protein
MDFEWDPAKELANRRKHGVGFRAAAKVFLDPCAIELDDIGVADEERFNVIVSSMVACSSSLTR